MTWTPRTLREERQDPAGATVLCPGAIRRCGRVVQSQMMVDVRGLDPALLTYRPHGQVPTHLCDACKELLVSAGRIDREGLARALGAPDQVLQKIRGHAAAQTPMEEGR